MKCNLTINSKNNINIQPGQSLMNGTVNKLKFGDDSDSHDIDNQDQSGRHEGFIHHTISPDQIQMQITPEYGFIMPEDIQGATLTVTTKNPNTLLKEVKHYDCQYQGFKRKYTDKNISGLT